MTRSGWRARVLGTRDLRAWDTLYRSHPAARAIVPKWDELAGWTNHALGLFRGDVLIGGLVLGVRRIPYLPVSLGRINCVMVGPTDHGAMLDVLLAAVERFSLRHLVVETELRLRIPTTDNVEGFAYHPAVRAALEGRGYHALHKIDTTYVVRLDRDDAGLIEGFERSARNKIRKAERSGVVVEPSHDPALMERFYDAYLEMSKRKHAPLQPRQLVVQGLKPLIDAGHAILFTERYGGVVSNMVVVDVLGLPCYVLGVRTEANVEGQVPGAAQALHYAIMRFLRDRGKTSYDLGGCEGPEPIEGHPNYGVWRFKAGFQGRFVRFLPYYRRTRGPLSGRILEAVHRYRGDYL